MRNWIYTFGVLLLVLWAVAHYGFHFYGEIHIVLVAGICVLLFQFIGEQIRKK